jgi:hypothetical protein
LKGPGLARFKGPPAVPIRVGVLRGRYIAPWLVALGAAALVGWLELAGYIWTDYENEVEPAYAALVGGDVSGFLHKAPAYGGSLAIRAPFALIAAAFGGGGLAVYRAVAIPCLLAAAALGVTLYALHCRRQDARAGMLVLLLAAANPVTLRALTIGHPEELFGGALCAGAVLAGLHRRPNLAGVLLGLAVANKAWAVLAIGPVLLALPEGRRRAAVIAFAVGGAVMLPFLIVGHSTGAVPAAHQAGAIFQPWQVWWPLGDTGQVIRGIDGNVKEGFRAAPAWLSPIPHPLIAGLVVPASLLYLRRRAGRAPEDVLALLAALMLARCLLDPWNIGYYHLPFLLALLSWEALRFGRAPVWSLAASLAVWATFEKAPGLLSPDAQCVLYLAWALPALAVLSVVAFRGVRGPAYTGRYAWQTAGSPLR